MTETTRTPSAASIARLRWTVRAYRHPCAALLAVQLFGLLAYPFFEGTYAGPVLLGALGIVVLLAAMGMVHRTAGSVWISASLAIPGVVLNAWQATSGSTTLLAWSAAFEAAFYFYATASLIFYMLADRRASSDELFAAGATFTLLAWGFTFLFVLCQALQPGCFAAAVHSDAPRTWTELAYLSFALLSSTGIGDVIPLTPQARALASLEMFVGVMYLTLVVSRLIGLTLLRRDD